MVEFLVPLRIPIRRRALTSEEVVLQSWLIQEYVKRHVGEGLNTRPLRAATLIDETSWHVLDGQDLTSPIEAWALASLTDVNI